VIPGLTAQIYAYLAGPTGWNSHSRVENTPAKGMLMADEVSNRNLALTLQTTDLRKR
jgi:hypothetical protein